MSIVRLALQVTARLRVEEDRPNDCLQVTAYVLTVVVEDRGNALHVGGRGITGDQVLNEPCRDERADVRMVEDRIEACLQVLRTTLPCGEGDTVDQLLGPRIMLGIDQGHLSVIVDGFIESRGTGQWRIGPAGKERCVALDGRLIVGRDR